MVLSPAVAKIKEDFDKVIRCSQNIEYPKTEKLFENWLEAKRDFIELFGGKYIYEYPEKVSFELGPKEKHERVMAFAFAVAEQWGYAYLGQFIEEQEEGFFKNITVKDAIGFDGKTIKKGTKLVRAFKHFVEDDRSLTDIQNEASRIIQEDKIEGRLCISVHPLDYLSLSENTYNWRSCHALDGEYRAGNLSYMMDKSTVVCYLKAENDAHLPNFPHDVPWNNKKWRVLLYLTKDWNMIFAGRQYPFETSVGLDFLLKKALIDAKICVEDDHRVKWSDWNNYIVSNVKLTNDIEINFEYSYIPVGRGLVPIVDVVKDAAGSRQFNDVLHSSCYKPVYAFKYIEHPWGGSRMAEGLYPECEVGAYTYCLYCGAAEVMSDNTMMCEDCELQYGDSDSDLFTYCEICGRRIYVDDSYYVEGVDVCQQCYDKHCTRCESCEESFYNEDIHYHEDVGQYLCNDCYEEMKENMEEAKYGSWKSSKRECS